LTIWALRSLSEWTMRPTCAVSVLSRSTLYRKVQAGTFPAPFKISERCSGWRESDIRAGQPNPMFYSVHD
jgi:prophage regulatory protein